MLTFLLAAATAATAADSVVYPVLNHDRPCGTMVVYRNGDSVRVRYVFTDRNRGTRIEMREVLRDDMVASLESRPVLADDRAGEPTFRIEIAGDSIRQVSAQRSSIEKVVPGIYYTATFTPFDQVRFARYLLRQPNHTARVSENTSVKLEILREATVPTKHGNERVRLVSMSTGNSPAPQLVWLDSRDDLFATAISWFMTVKAGAEPALPQLRKIEMAIDDAQAEALNKRLLKPTSGTIAITGGDVFDSETGRMRPHMNVIIRGDRIAAVGPAESTPAPSGATIIDATGRTVVPGLWDMHGHMQETSQLLLGVMQLSTVSPRFATLAQIRTSRCRIAIDRKPGSSPCRARSFRGSSTALARGPARRQTSFAPKPRPARSSRTSIHSATSRSSCTTSCTRISCRPSRLKRTSAGCD